MNFIETKWKMAYNSIKIITFKKGTKERKKKIKITFYFKSNLF